MVEQNDKRLLWDSGLPLSLAGGGRQAMEHGIEVDYPVSLLDQLDELGLHPADIDYASFSHFHFDHVGAANAFAEATLLIDRNEHMAAFTEAERHEVFVPELYMGLRDSDKLLLDDDHDVFGDSSVVIVPAPGHTPGHSVLFVDLEETGPVVLSGDLYHFDFSRRMRRTPVFNTDTDETLESMDKIEALLKEKGATLWIEHNKALADTLKKAPDFYE
jgi:glyoxylase-like metal-dependent hydrolase (beta-lactamase superfamily II)